MKNWLRIFADDEGSGLWDRGNKAVDPHGLPISDDLRSMLGEWMRAYMYRAEWNPGASRTSEKFRDFARDGLLLAQAFKAELPSWIIVYHDAAAGARHKEADGDGDACEYEVTPWTEWLELRREPVKV